MSEILVIMPYKRHVYLQGKEKRETDFDVLYELVVKRAVESTGNQCLRIDEIVEVGNLSSTYLNRIVNAELVIAELSMANGNVYYELGVRQSLSSRPTLLIAEEGTQLPFDVRNQRVLLYRWDTIEQMQDAILLIAKWIEDLPHQVYVNPVHQYLKATGLAVDPSDPLAFERDFNGKIERAKTSEQLNAVWSWARAFDVLPPFALLRLAEKFSLVEDWATAATVARSAVTARPDDYEIHRTLGWYLRKAGEPFYAQAEQEFRQALRLNRGDLEALGMLGGLLKRRGEYAEAAELYARGVRDSPDNLYLRVAQAGMTLLSDPTPSSRALKLYEELLALCTHPDKLREPWALAVAGEAYFALGDDAAALEKFHAARQLSASPTVLISPAEQIALIAERGYRQEEGQRLAAELKDLATQPRVRVDRQRSIRQDSAEPPRPVLVHLSDPHFGFRSKGGKKVDMHRFKDGDYSLTLQRHMLNELTAKDRRLRFALERMVLIISGDIVYQAGPEEYQRALAFCEELAKGLGIPKQHILFCPGNHDVSWPDAKTDPVRRFDNYLAFLNDFYGKSLFRRLYPQIEWNLKVNSRRPHPTDLIGIARFPELHLEVYSFNSCVYETEQHHYGFVGGKQLRKMEPLLDETADEQPIRVAVLHHHIHPYPEPIVLDGSGAHAHDASTLRDAGLFERFLEKHGFDIVLHGHKHKAQLRETWVRDGTPSAERVKPLIVCGAGSCGVNSDELEHSIPNHYQVIELLSSSRTPGTEFLKVEWRELAVAEGAEWTTRGVWTVNG